MLLLQNPFLFFFCSGSKDILMIFKRNYVIIVHICCSVLQTVFFVLLMYFIHSILIITNHNKLPYNSKMEKQNNKI